MDHTITVTRHTLNTKTRRDANTLVVACKRRKLIVVRGSPVNQRLMRSRCNGAGGVASDYVVASKWWIENVHIKIDLFCCFVFAMSLGWLSMNNHHGIARIVDIDKSWEVQIDQLMATSDIMFRFDVAVITSLAWSGLMSLRVGKKWSINFLFDVWCVWILTKEVSLFRISFLLIFGQL